MTFTYKGIVKRNDVNGALLEYPKATVTYASQAGLDDQTGPREEFCPEAKLKARIALAGDANPDATAKLQTILDHLTEVNAAELESRRNSGPMLGLDR